MSRIFISHNSADNEITKSIVERLQSAGFECVFVDFDPDKGIAAGKNWELELYRELRACRLLIFLSSKASVESQWCFFEVAHAKSLGKPIIPVLIEECATHSILQFQQQIDWTGNCEEAWKRLQRGVLEAGMAGDAPNPRPPRSELSGVGVRFRQFGLLRPISTGTRGLRIG